MICIDVKYMYVCPCRGAEVRFRGNDSVNEMHDDQEAPAQTTHVRKRVPTKFVEVKAGCLEERSSLQFDP